MTVEGKRVDWELESDSDEIIDGTGLLIMPALIDPHVHFRTPGLEHKENWLSASKAAIRGGITTVFDMPNTVPASITLDKIRDKKQLIDSQLEVAGIPLRYNLYLGADKLHFAEIERAKEDVIGLKIFMGSSTGDLVMDDEESLEAAFQLAAENDILVAVHAEDEALLKERKAACKDLSFPRLHSHIRSHEVAYLATKKAIELAKKYGARLYLLHIGTRQEVELIAAAKKEGVKVFAETTPHHLFLTEEAYDTLGSKVQMNPPLRTADDVDALWKGIREGVIDTIGSDHAPHTLTEKDQPYGLCPSGIPGVETTLPLLLNAVHEGRLKLSDIIRLMLTRVETIFRLEPNDDVVLVDLEKTKMLKNEELATKCGWSPYAGRELKGWPVTTILKGKVFHYE